MSFDYDEAAADALELLAEYGINSVQVTTPGAGTYDASSATVSNTPTVDTGTGALLDYNLRDLGKSNAPGTLIEATDKKLLLAPAGITIEPSPKTTIRFGSTVYKVVTVKTVAPAGIPVLYILQVRK